MFYRFVTTKIGKLNINELKPRIMTKVKMTIHRALAELKVMDSRIERGILALDPIGVKQQGKLVNRIVEEKDFNKLAHARFQSVHDLIGRKIAIKSAIVISNGKTKVEIAGKTMTVADAITFKDVVVVKDSLIEHLKRQRNKVLAKFNTENEKLNEVALQNARIMLGKSAEDKLNPTDVDVAAITDPFVKRSELHLVDPLGVEVVIGNLESELQEFLVEVDAVLSESNAITTIKV